MASRPGSFTDREEAVYAFDRLLQPHPPARVLTIVGDAGQGKSTLLAHFRNRAQHANTSIIDTQNFVEPAGAGPMVEPLHEMFDQLVGQLERWSGMQFRRCRTEFRQRDESAARVPGITIEQHATWGGRIDHSPITVDADASAPRITEARRLHRRQFLEALRRDLGASPRLDGVLFFDTLESLALIDDVRAAPDGGVRHWLATFLIPTLLEASASLRVVLAGRDALSLPDGVNAGRVELTSWTRDDTIAFLRSCAIEREDLHDVAHISCGGTPGWIALLVDTVQLAGEDQVQFRSSDLAVHAAEEPGKDWLVSQFFTHLPPEVRPLIETAAVPRVIEEDFLDAAGVGHDSSGLLETLLRFSFISREITRGPHDGTAAGALRMHPLPRTAILGYLRGQRPERYRALHALAGRYSSRRAHRADEYYHFFAMADTANAATWADDVRLALRAARLGEARRLIEAATAIENQAVLTRSAPSTLMLGYSFDAEVNRLQGFVRESERRSREASELARREGNEGEVAKQTLAQAVRTMRHGNVLTALLRLEEAQARYELLDDEAGLAQVLRRRGEISLRLPDLDAAASAFQAGIERFVAMDDPIGAAFCHRGLAEVSIHRGEDENARVHLAQAIADFHKYGEKFGAAYAKRLLAHLEGRRGATARASVLLDQAYAFYESKADKLGVAETQATRGEVDRLNGALDDAVEALSDAAARFEAINSPFGQAETLRRLAQVAEVQSRGHDALALHTEADRLYRGAGSAWTATRTTRPV